MTALALAALALLFAGPVPRVLARATVLRRAPRAAMVLWQSVALAAVLAAVGAGVVLLVRSLRAPIPYALTLVVFSGGLTVLVLGRLLVSGHRVGTRVRLLRRRHRRMVDLLGRDRDGAHVIAHESPMAYCLPGLGGSRVVLSQPLVDLLEEPQVAAVLAHERAHLRARHDLVLEAFTVLNRAFPVLVTSARALAEVRLLVEVLADRAAVRRCGRMPLARALVALADVPVPDAALGAGGTGLVERLDLLRDDRPHRLLAAAGLVSALVVLLAPTGLLLAAWIGSPGG